MRKLNLLFVLAMSATLLLTACGDQEKIREANRQVDAVVKKIIGGDRSASENPEARRIHLLDFDHDGVKDVIALFTIEGMGGGNNYSFYMIALRSKGEGLVKAGTLKVGAKGKRHVNFDAVRLENRMLLLEVTEYGPDDPMCCPSKVATAKFEVMNGTLRELTKGVQG